MGTAELGSFSREIEVLAVGHLGLHPDEEVADFAETVVVDTVGAVHEVRVRRGIEQISPQDGSGTSKVRPAVRRRCGVGDVSRGQAPSIPGIIDDVVVNYGAGLEKFQTGPQI